MQLSTEQLRRRIGNNKLRCFAAAAAGGLAWFGGFILLAKLHGPFGPGWMVPFGAIFLVGGLGAMVLPVYVVNRRYCPRCAACGAYICDEQFVDEGECPRCHAPLTGAA